MVLQRHVALPAPQSLAVSDGPVPFSLHGPWPLLKHRAYSGRTASCAISAAHGGPRFSSSKPYVRCRHTDHTHWGTLDTPIGARCRSRFGVRLQIGGPAALHNRPICALILAHVWPLVLGANAPEVDGDAPSARGIPDLQDKSLLCIFGHRSFLAKASF